MAMVRWDGTVTCQSSALMIVDIQHDFLDGALAVPGAGEILPTVYSLLDDHQIGWKAVVASQVRRPCNSQRGVSRWLILIFHLLLSLILRTSIPQIISPSLPDTPPHRSPNYSGFHHAMMRSIIPRP